MCVCVSMCVCGRRVCVCAHMIIPEGSLIPGGNPGTPPGLPYMYIQSSKILYNGKIWR